MTTPFEGPQLARTDIPTPLPILPGLRSLATWIEACLEGDHR
ncbi:hypothetical protein SAMN05444851_2105 [Aliiroseovarius sediminilitoris]|uniref:Uncharacterized protein n=1 Tax=Aliiroseovarius sediminilitoris TaxID=1173584 RepID=A0A1I0Q0P4_9RHOB|nr:hypothetical protein [Aliiroseovarius sediminilitoris]SEW20431.1 hypothetical protein SAMN05444851_2105 [Aliiroseovarius sediminilitoris]